MKKTVTALVAAAFMVAAMIAAPAPAGAQTDGDFWVGLGLGVAAGALLAPPPEPRYRTYAPRRGYYAIDHYRGRPPVACRGGFWAARPVAYDRRGRPTRWSQARWVCPGRGVSARHFRYDERRRPRHRR